MLKIILALVVGLVGPAVAAPTDDDTTARIESLAQKASARYKANQYAEAVELYLEAYRLGKAAALLYNVAVIYDRKIEDRELAITYYRRYITAPDADPAAVSRATERVQVLKAAQAKADTERRTEELAAAQRRKDAADARREPPPPAVIAAPPPARPDRSAGWLVTAIGAASLGVGAGIGVGAAADQTAFDDSEALNEKLELRDSGGQKALIADILMGVGAVGIITGVVMLLTAEADTPAVGVLPTADGHGGAVFFGGSL